MQKRFDAWALVPEHVDTGEPMLDELGEIESVISLAIERTRTLRRHANERGEPPTEEYETLMFALRQASAVVQFGTYADDSKRGVAKSAMTLVDLLLEAVSKETSIKEEFTGDHVRDALNTLYKDAPTVADELLEPRNFEVLVEAVNEHRRGRSKAAFLRTVHSVAYSAAATESEDFESFERQYRRHSKTTLPPE